MRSRGNCAVLIGGKAGRMLTGHTFRHLGLADPARDPGQFQLLESRDDDLYAVSGCGPLPNKKYSIGTR